MSQNPNLVRNPDYHAVHAEEERRLAESTNDLNARAAHEQMAEKYARLARATVKPEA